MPRVQADFTKISSSSEPVPAGEHRCVLYEIEETKTKEKQLAQFVFKSRITEGEHENREIWDYVVMETKEKKPNKMGLGRLKGYAEAIMGEEYANSPEGINTDDLLNGGLVIVTKIGMSKKNEGTPQEETVPRTEIVRLLRQ